MALSERGDRIARWILAGEITQDVTIDKSGQTLATTPGWRKKAKAAGIRVQLAERIVTTVQRALEDEGEVRIYFIDDRQTGSKDDWYVMVGVNDPDGAVFIGITPETLEETRDTNGLIFHIREMLDNVRPSGRPFGIQPSLN
jgi:hypothetical protein